MSKHFWASQLNVFHGLDKVASELLPMGSVLSSDSDPWSGFLKDEQYITERIREEEGGEG